MYLKCVNNTLMATQIVSVLRTKKQDEKVQGRKEKKIKKGQEEKERQKEKRNVYMLFFLIKICLELS